MKCLTCSRELNDPADLTTRDCGGDCLACMASAGDPDCIRAVIELAQAKPKLPADVVAILADILKPDPTCLAIFEQRDQIRLLLEKYQ